jgi:hypothetical protein
LVSASSRTSLIHHIFSSLALPCPGDAQTFSRHSTLIQWYVEKRRDLCVVNRIERNENRVGELLCGGWVVDRDMVFLLGADSLQGRAREPIAAFSDIVVLYLLPL